MPGYGLADNYTQREAKNERAPGAAKAGAVATVLSKKPIFLLMLCIAVIVLLLLFSIFDQGKRENSAREQETLLIEPEHSSVSTDEEGLNLPKAP